MRHPPKILLVVCLLPFLAIECSAPTPPPDSEEPKQYLPRLPLGLGSGVPVPPDNPLTRAKVELGRQLFFEKQLSRDKTLSCASCHDPRRGYSDGLGLPVGIDGVRGRRNVPTLLNIAYREPLFWDGRAFTLEEQVVEVITSPRELGGVPAEVVRRLEASQFYRQLFLKAFGSQRITLEGVAQAIASFERTLLSADSTFDRFEDLRDARQFPAAVGRGLRLFRGKANCTSCHKGFLFTDNGFHNTGVGWGQKAPDWGRYEVTGLEEDRGRFKTPTLRDLASTAPYMHNGSIPTLEEVVGFYDRGGGANPSLDNDIRPLHLTDREKKDLILFLRSLSGTSWQDPKWPRMLIH